MYPRHETEFSSTRCHCVVVYSFKISSAIAPWRHSWLLRIKVVALFLVVSLSLLIGSLPSPNAGSSAFLPARTRGEAGRCSLLDANLQCGRGLHRISDAKPISRNTKTPHAAVSTFPEDGRIFERQVRLLQLKMPLRVELVQRRVREQANRQCKLRVVREHVQIQPALSGRPVRLWRMIVWMYEWFIHTCHSNIISPFRWISNSLLISAHLAKTCRLSFVADCSLSLSNKDTVQGFAKEWRAHHTLPKDRFNEFVETS